MRGNALTRQIERMMAGRVSSSRLRNTQCR
jgi:hypothetical protein